MANLLTGARLGPYEILAPRGAGGTGEVCRARDNRRLDREAKTISQLDHPKSARCTTSASRKASRAAAVLSWAAASK